MADKFNEQLDRMKALMSYGQVNENTKPVNNYSIEYRAEAADGKTYGIIRECNRYYIKRAQTGKETIAESYEYLGGWANKKDFEYNSYPQAYKQFELKMASINEAFDAKVDTSILSPFMKQELMTEASETMQKEIARQRQIMYNASMIMNESKDYAVKGGEACHTDQPEAETGKKGDKVEDSKDSKANPEYAGSKTSGVDKKAEPFKENPTKSKDQLKEELDTDFDSGLKGFGSVENGEADTDHNNDPFTENVNEGECCSKCGKCPCECGETDECGKLCEDDEKEWDEGLPASAGVGEADTDHNNDPFKENVNEGEEDDTDFDAGLDDEFSEKEDNGEFDDSELGNNELEGSDGEFEEEPEDEFSDEEDFSGEDFDSEDGDFENEVDEEDPDSLRAEIERLQAKLDALEGDEESFEEEPEDEFGSEEYNDEDFEEEPENKFDSEEEFPEDDFSDEEGDVEECGINPLMEAKRAKMNSIVESVVAKIIKEKKQKINEDELHVFGKHPGYRKKPMELPKTGEDKNQWGRDWNDESTHSEEPFGQKIGDGDPFNQLVDAITKDVMYQLKHGAQIEGENKKKAE